MNIKNPYMKDLDVPDPNIRVHEVLFEGHSKVLVFSGREGAIVPNMMTMNLDTC